MLTVAGAFDINAELPASVIPVPALGAANARFDPHRSRVIAKMLHTTAKPPTDLSGREGTKRDLFPALIPRFAHPVCRAGDEEEVMQVWQGTKKQVRP